MKTLLTFFILLFSSSIFAEDISDFQIEGMSIGDSLLDYMSEEEIKNNVGFIYPDKEFSVSTYIKTNKNYDKIGIEYKSKDRKYIIYGIFGYIYFSNNISTCYKKQEEIIKDLELLFGKNSFNDWGILVFKEKDNSTYRPITYEFISEDAISVSCYNFPLNPINNNLKVSILSKEFKEYLYSDIKKIE